MKKYGENVKSWGKAVSRLPKETCTVLMSVAEPLPWSQPHAMTYIEKGRFDLPQQSEIRSPKGKVWDASGCHQRQTVSPRSGIHFLLRRECQMILG